MLPLTFRVGGIVSCYCSLYSPTTSYYRSRFLVIAPVLCYRLLVFLMVHRFYLPCLVYLFRAVPGFGLRAHGWSGSSEDDHAEVQLF